MVSQDILLHFPLIRNKAEQTQERASASLFRKSSLFIPWPIYQLHCTTSLFLGTLYILDIKYTDPLSQKLQLLHTCLLYIAQGAFPWKRVFL